MEGAVLGGGTAYIDVGSTVSEPLSVRGAFDDIDDRSAMLLKIGKSASLSNGRGLTVTATLVESTPIDLGTTFLYFADLVFEA